MPKKQTAAESGSSDRESDHGAGKAATTPHGPNPRLFIAISAGKYHTAQLEVGIWRSKEGSSIRQPYRDVESKARPFAMPFKIDRSDGEKATGLRA
jgi:hypothetical protein